MITYALVTGEQTALLAVSIVCIVVDSTIVLLRLWAALKIRRSFDWSDAALVVAWISTTGLAIATIAGTFIIGIGWHELDALSHNNFDSRFLKMQADFTQAISELWAVSVCFAKLSLLFVYYRYFEVKYMKIGVRICTVYVVTLLLVMFIGDGLICLPFESRWNPVAIETWCGKKQTDLFIATSALHTISDFIILILPIPCIWSLQLPAKKKINLSVMFSAGLITSVVSILRIWSLTLADWTDVLYTEWSPIFLSVLEPSMTICLACIPFLRPIFNKEQRMQRDDAASRSADVEMQRMTRSTGASRLKSSDVSHSPVGSGDN